MASAYVQEFAIIDGDTSTTNYDEVVAALGMEAAPDGLIVHTSGFDNEAGVFRIFDVWESQEAWLRFNDQRLIPLIQPMIDSGEAPPTTEYTYELHDVVKG